MDGIEDGFNCTVEGRTSTKAQRIKTLQQSKRHNETPEAYITYTECEEKCNKHVHGFCSEILQAYPHLKSRLFVNPENEYGSKRFVCTTIQPTLLPQTEIYNLRRCSEFVSRYVDYEPLGVIDNGDASFLEYPVVSPAQTINWATGDCFDMSFLLASLLCGAGYDAYVVLGNAPAWIRRKDQSHMQCTLEECSDGIVDKSAPCIGISLKDKSFKQRCSIPDESVAGIHCWVLVKPDKRDIDDGPVFVESSTGICYPVDAASPYLDIWSVWNNENCWVNVKDASTKELGIEFVDNKKWVHLYPGKELSVPPYSWVGRLQLSSDQFRLSYPSGRRSIKLRKAALEFFGYGVDPQGLAARVSFYDDLARTVMLQCTELFFPNQRKDYMIRRVRRPKEMMHQEFFSLKNEFSICEKKEIAGRQECIKFYYNTRADGLVDRVEEIGNVASITENFQDRFDGLSCRISYLTPLPSIGVKGPKPNVVGTGMGLAILNQIE